MHQRIVCAANKYEINGEVIIILGARHFDQRMVQQINRLPPDIKDRLTKSTDCQGFIDQHGKFLTRTEAWKIAEANGQIRHRVGGDSANGGTLYSENLY